MSAPTLDLSVIIVNWRSVPFLRNCLASLCREAPDFSLEILVVDNASNDGCGDMLRREFPSVTFIQSPENLGFSRANNLGFSRSRGRALLFLNPDTEIRGKAVTILFDTLFSSPECGAVGARLLNTDLSLQTSCILPFPTLMNQILDSARLQSLLPGWSLWGQRPARSSSKVVSEVEAVSGACLMVKRPVFETCGLFSADYFMYSEDVDLCYRIRRNGYKVLYAGEAAVVHHGGASSSRTDNRHFHSIQMRESTAIFMRKYYSARYAACYQAAMAAVAAIRIVLLFFASPWKGRTSRGKWKHVLRWALNLEQPAGRLSHPGIG